MFKPLNITFGEEDKIPLYGNLDEYHPEGEETWGEYIERLEHFFVANEVGDEKKSQCCSVFVGPNHIN